MTPRTPLDLPLSKSLHQWPGLVRTRDLPQQWRAFFGFLQFSELFRFNLCSLSSFGLDDIIFIV